MNTLCKISFALVLISGLFNSASAQTEREKGVKLYQEGKNKEAVAVLERASKQTKTDAETWNALGLAYARTQEMKKAVKSFEKAVSFDQQNAVYHTNLAYAYLQGNQFNKAQSESNKAIAINPKTMLAYYVRGTANIYEGNYDEAIRDADRAIAINPNYSLAYTLKSDTLLHQFGNQVGKGSKPIEKIELLQKAEDVLNVCLKTCTDNSQAGVQQKQIETLKVFREYFSKNPDALARLVDDQPAAVTVAPKLPEPGVTPLKILAKSPPRYTDKARSENISGTITMAVFFADTGQITHAIILKGLGGGLNENALQAAYSIKFEPAKKDGKPFSQVKTITYSFTIY